MLLRLAFAIILFFAIYYILKNNGYISIDQHFDSNKIFVFGKEEQNLLKKKPKNENLQKSSTEEIINDKSKEINELQNELRNEDKDEKKNVYLDIQINKKDIFRIELELYDDIVPKTCANFRSLCEQKMYQKSIFHRIIKDFMVQGGDFTKGNGTGGRSIYGESFNDENFNIKHDKKGILSMANRGPNTNNSQFFIIYEPQPSLDNKHVAFGCIKKGFDVLDKLNSMVTDYNNKPASECMIVDSGTIVQKEGVDKVINQGLNK